MLAHHCTALVRPKTDDLAELYGVETGALNRAVKRNIARFPGDFMFQLTMDAAERLRRQIGTLRAGRGQHRKYLPYAFTEQGVAMLSSALRSKRAVRRRRHASVSPLDRSLLLITGFKSSVVTPTQVLSVARYESDTALGFRFQRRGEFPDRFDDAGDRLVVMGDAAFQLVKFLC